MMSNDEYYGMLSLPHASEDFKKANPQMFERKSVPVRSARRGRMNKIEAEYAMILEAQKRRGEILRYEFEGITLRWADMKYTPDFIVFRNEWCDDPSSEGFPISLIEVKGGHIWSRDIVRFKGARAHWPEFSFEMWQKKQGQWTRLH